MRQIDLTSAAEEDLAGIWLYTYENRGLEQADRYYDQIVACCEAIGDGKARSKPLERMSEDVQVFRCEQHYIFFLPNDRPVVLAILHGRMDFISRLKKRLE